MKADEVLDRAADEILINGHTKDKFGTPDGAKCALGAIYYVGGEYCLEGGNISPNLAGKGPARIADLALGKYLGDGITLWNDDPETTAAEVMDAMRMTAKELRENEG